MFDHSSFSLFKAAFEKKAQLENAVSPKTGLVQNIGKILALLNGSNKLTKKVARSVKPKAISIAETIIEKTKGDDLMQISPLGALQLAIKHIEQGAKNRKKFNDTLAQIVFAASPSYSNKEIESLWEKSLERKVLYEIYSLIDIARDVKRPITFRDAFIRVYDNSAEKDRAPLNRLTKALIIRR